MGTLVDLFIFLLVIAILWWAYGQLTLPPPVKMVAAVVIAIVAIFWLLSFAGGGLGHHSILSLPR